MFKYVSLFMVLLLMVVGSSRGGRGVVGVEGMMMEVVGMMGFDVKSLFRSGLERLVVWGMSSSYNMESSFFRSVMDRGGLVVLVVVVLCVGDLGVCVGGVLGVGSILFLFSWWVGLG